MNLQDIEAAFCAAAITGARRLKAQLMNAAASGAIESTAKADGSHVTPIDEDVEQTMGEMLVKTLRHRERLAVVGEESGELLGRYGEGMYVVLFDPTDGTALVRLLVPGSTTGVCLYDTYRRRFLAAAVADPWLERVVFTREGETFQQQFDPADGTLLGEPVSCRVSNKTLEDGGLLIEVAHGFFRREFLSGEQRQVLTQYEISRLWHQAHASLGAKVRSLSSNLMHQLAVAVGGAPATIMTAVGGPWDLSGVALVLGAGGAVLFVRVSDNGEFVLTDDPMAADLVICANSVETAQQVFDLLLSIRY